MKYSIIIPVYNTSKYLNKCIKSAINQDYENIEIIIVNDGSTDDSLEIIKKYTKKYKNIVLIDQKNKGLSEARNAGIKKATGDYFLLLDSDDFIEYNLISKLNEYTSKNPDLIRFQLRTIDEDGNLISDYHEKAFELTNGSKGFELITSYRFVEVSTIYLYNTNYFKKNKFKFKPGVSHEDFGLIPLVIEKADSIISIDYVGYNYLQRNESIMHSKDYDKLKKKAFDVLIQYEDLIKYNGSRYYKSYITNSVISKSKDLNSDDYKRYKNKLKEIKAIDYLLSDTLKRKIKKLYYKIIYR